MLGEWSDPLPGGGLREPVAVLAVGDRQHAKPDHAQTLAANGTSPTDAAGRGRIVSGLPVVGRYRQVAAGDPLVTVAPQSVAHFPEQKESAMYHSFQQLRLAERPSREDVMGPHAKSPAPSARARRGRAAVGMGIATAVVAALLSGCGGTAPGSDSSPAGSGDTIVAPAAPSDPATAPADDSSSGAADSSSSSDSSPGDLSPQDMNEICAGGAVCDPSSSGPPYVDGGGLALPDGGS